MIKGFGFAKKKKYIKKRCLIITKALLGSSSFDPDKIFSQKVEEPMISDEAKEWVKKLPKFEQQFVDVPAKIFNGEIVENDAERKTAQNKNAGVTLEYIRTSLDKNEFPASSFDQFVATQKAAMTTKFKDIDVLIGVKKMLNEDNYYIGFLEAIEYIIAQNKQINSTVAEIGLSLDEFQNCSANLTSIGRVKAAWGRFTSSSEYLLKTSFSEKKANQKAFNAWLQSKMSELTKIVNLNFSDIPLTVGITERSTASTGVMNSEKQKLLKNLLIDFKKSAVVAWRADQDSFKLSNWLGKIRTTPGLIKQKDGLIST